MARIDHLITKLYVNFLKTLNRSEKLNNKWCLTDLIPDRYGIIVVSGDPEHGRTVLHDEGHHGQQGQCHYLG